MRIASGIGRGQKRSLNQITTKNRFISKNIEDPKLSFYCIWFMVSLMSDNLTTYLR
jgi:hypothetical protein